MRQGNKALRDHAIPFISEYVEFSSITAYGSTALLVPQVMTGNTAAVPMTRPEKGDIVEAYLYMELTAPSDKALTIRLGIGEFTTDANGDLTVIPSTNYSQDYLNTQHRKIAGTDSRYTVAANGTLVIDADLTNSIPKRGDTGFLSDAFCLLVTFDSLPDTNNGYSLDKIKLNCTAQMGFGT